MAPKPNFGPINEKNFFVSSYAEFHKVQDSKLPQRKADYISYVRRRVRDEDLEMYDYEETDCISSEYRYTEKGVFRRSDHRGPKIRSCSWELLKEDYSYRYNDKIEIGFCPRKDFLHKKEFYLSDEDYWDTKSKEDLPNIPLEFLGKEQRIFEFDKIWKSRIYDLSSPLEQHPRHYTDYVTLLIKQE